MIVSSNFMRTLIFILIFTFQQLNTFSSCGVDDRTLTEMLFQNKAGTIFSCKILTMTTPKYDNDINAVSSCGGGIDGTATAEIIAVFFGKVDTSIITLKTGSNLLIGKSYIIYTTGDGVVFSCGGSCDNRTHQIANSAEDISELKILNQFSDIYKNNKSGKYIFLSSTKKVLATGEFKKGIPVKTWNHYFASGILKTQYDLKFKQTKFYSASGLIIADNIEYKDSSVNLSYSNLVKGQLNYRWVTIKNNNGFITTMYEYYPNSNLKLCESTVYIEVRGGGTTTDGKTGKYIEGYENGKVKVTGELNKSKRLGLWKWYNDDGSFYAEFDYKDGTGGQ